MQEIVASQLPMIPLVSPHVLVGARKDLANFKPALLEPYGLWNLEQFYWRTGAGR